MLLLGAMAHPVPAPAERLPNNAWQLLAVGYPEDREVEVRLGGAEKTLIAKGRGKVRWKNGTSTVELRLEDLSGPEEVGWTGRQYILWAVDHEKRIVNLGRVPLNSHEAKWRLQVPFRIFGLLVTAETDPQAATPSVHVALESLLPTNPTLVVPAFRVPLALAP
ncbi:MAG TPA: hypothetical protein VNN17_09095 [Terriglobia bacterium]|nr:hypothetical protein [Terriglobia bacterium]